MKNRIESLIAVSFAIAVLFSMVSGMSLSASHLKVVVCIPESPQVGFLAQLLQTALKNWQEEDQQVSLASGHVISSSHVSLSLSTVAISNDTGAILPLLCDAIENHSPSLILSLVDRETSFLIKTVAKTSSVPLLTWSREYQDLPPLGQRTSDFKLLENSLDTDVSDLADATFNLLQAQEWFDAILLIDDSTASDRLRFRLANLCKPSLTSNGSWREGRRSNTSPGIQSLSWNRLMIVQVSKSLLQNEMYLRMSSIQSNYRRVILVHCDKSSTRRIVDAAHSLFLFSPDKIWIFLDGMTQGDLLKPDSYQPLQLPIGVLHVSLRSPSISDSNTLSSLMTVVGTTAARVQMQLQGKSWRPSNASCWTSPDSSKSELQYPLVHRELNHVIEAMKKRRFGNLKCPGYSNEKTELMEQNDSAMKVNNAVMQQEQNVLLSDGHGDDVWSNPVFDVLNLVPCMNGSVEKVWKVVGNITRRSGAVINAIKLSSQVNHEERRGHRFRVVTGIAPPFVQESTRLVNGSCLTGIPCLRVNTSQAEEMVSIFTDFHSKTGFLEGQSYHVHCCAGISIDLLNAIARDLHFEFDLYLVADGLFGVPRAGHWDGITADLVSGTAHMAFTAFSVTSSRVEVIDYSVPFFYSGVSCLSFSRYSDQVPLSAFLVPFSTQLWIAIFASLFITSIFAALYEWFSPFGLNPWGRQRTKNFSLASALWVMTSLLFSHLVTFKAPKSWPNKVLINVWAGFSVIFLATYTANIAAHFAGLFSEVEVKDFHDGILMSLKTGVARSSASEGYIMKENMELWSHIQKNRVKNLEEGLEKLRARRLEVLIGDTAILDFFRANDPGCNLRLLGDSIFDDAYAVGFQRGFPLKDAISHLILQYNAFGFLDQLQRKWYGRVPCLEDPLNNLNKPNPLGIRAVAGVFIMLGCGLVASIILLILEHIVFKYFLPYLRTTPKGSIWKSPNLMLFSQKLFRFVNTVELVSPHHSAKEIMASLKEGQITSLFQKSLKRKAKEDARRRKSKSQFFEMIQEVRKVVQEQKDERRSGLSGDESILVSVSGPAHQRLSGCNSLPLPSSSSQVLRQPRTKLEKNSLEVDEVEGVRIPSIRWKDTISSSAQEVVHEPDLQRSPPPFSNLKVTAPVVTASASATQVPLSLDTSTRPDLLDTFTFRLTKSASLEAIHLQTHCGFVSREENGHSIQKSWSSDDLCVLRIQEEEDLGDEDYWNQYSDAILPVQRCRSPAVVLITGPRNSCDSIDPHKLKRMKKDAIITLWKSAEKELLDSLQIVLEEKRFLESKLERLEKMLQKPP